ncbi:MAG: S-methyl-5-thioribose-1-phosphate isomerase [Candidatus Melainabacteria bacterium]|nr:S-methyl-5-thioribose-1-phosphate isomerase [Candidatus Melainabacteria bacterium]
MKLNQIATRSISQCNHGQSVQIIDQRQLPWRVVFETLETLDQVEVAIREMWVRGAPLIGATAAYGLCFAVRHNASNASIEQACQRLLATRPTAVNLAWAVEAMRQTLLPLPEVERTAAAYAKAAAICDEDVALCQAIGQHGLTILQPLVDQIATGAHPEQNASRRLNILTHCNAGWLATVDYGTALSPVYLAHDAGWPVHVWVDETRPRNQGALLTAFELAEHGVPHTVISDNAGGLLMRRGQVDVCIVGADRVTRNGDVCNKVGTYLKALAAFDNQIPFYVALPYTTLDTSLASGEDIPIEDRSPEEVTHIQGQHADGSLQTVLLTQSSALNPAFDVTPARLITGYITERGVFSNIAAALAASQTPAPLTASAP